MPIYMRYTRGDGLRVRGGVTAKGYEGWIELQSMQINQTRGPVNGSTKAASVPPPSSVTITKEQDGASNELYGELVRRGVGTAQIDFTKLEKGKPAAHMTLMLEGVTISTYSTSGAGGDGTKAPTESLVLEFPKVSYHVHGAAAPVVPNRSQWGGMWDMGRGA